MPASDSAHVPAEVAGLLMRPLPGAALAPLLDLGMTILNRRHPDLFARLESLGPRSLLVCPSDLPHRFHLAFGEGKAKLTLAQAEDTADATVKGSLMDLIALLEGRVDGDQLFFSRALVVSGDTEVVVALRNALDGAEISLIDDLLSPLGPLAGPAARLARVMEGVAGRILNSIRGVAASLHGALHSDTDTGRDLARECDRLREEVTHLKSRLSKMEARRASGAKVAPQ